MRLAGHGKQLPAGGLHVIRLGQPVALKFQHLVSPDHQGAGMAFADGLCLCLRQHLGDVGGRKAALQKRFLNGAFVDIGGIDGNV